MCLHACKVAWYKINFISPWLSYLCFFYQLTDPHSIATSCNLPTDCSFATIKANYFQWGIRQGVPCFIVTKPALFCVFADWPAVMSPCSATNQITVIPSVLHHIENLYQRLSDLYIYKRNTYMDPL